MKKKIIIPTLLSAALFTGCVKDTESDSVKNYRDAQTENVKAEAALSKAKAETEKQEMAIKAQEAEHKKQLVEFQKQQNAIETQKLETQKELDKVNLEIAKAKSEAEKVALEKEKALLEQQQAQVKLETADLELKIEKAKLDAEKQKLQAELALAQERAKINTSDVSEKAILLDKYTTALRSLNTLKGNLADANFDIVSLRNGVDAQKVANQGIATKENRIKVLNTEKEVLKSATTNVQDKKIEKAKKEAEQKEKNIAYQVAMDNFNTEQRKYNYDKFQREFNNAQNDYSLYLSRFFHTVVVYDNYRTWGSFLTNHSNSAYISTYALRQETVHVIQDGFPYNYSKYFLLEAKNLTEVEREIAYLKNISNTHKTELEAKTTALTNAKKATAEAKKAWEAATGADKEVKFQEYGLKSQEERTAQTEYDTAKGNYETALKDVENFEKVLALLNNLEPFNKVIEKYNKHLAGLSSFYFAQEKARKAYNDVSDEIAIIQGAINALEAGNVPGRISEIDTEVQGLQSEINNLKSNLTNKEELVASKEREIANLNAEIEATEKLVEALKAKL